MKKFILFFALFTSLITYAQNTGSLVGKLIDLDANNDVKTKAELKTEKWRTQSKVPFARMARMVSILF